MRHERRVLGERFDPAEALRAREDAKRAQKGRRLLDRGALARAAFQLERDHSARTAHLPRRQGVAVVRGEAWIRTRATPG